MPDPNFFRNDIKISLADLAEKIDCSISGEADLIISGVAPIDKATNKEISFLSNQKYLAAAKETQAAACIIDKKNAGHLPNSTIALVSDNPYVSYAKAANFLHPATKIEAKISDKASISESAVIGNNCFIGDNVVIGDNAQIGDNCVIHHNVIIGDNVIIGYNTVIHSQASISFSIIGNYVVIHSGSRIGQDGFGFATDHGRHIKIPQLGRVIVEDFVDIGANSCIDRGAGPDTVIGEGTYIDNLVQIGHNVTIGRGCIIVSQVGISGSTKLGNYVVLGGQVGVAGHLNIGNMAQVAAKSGVTKDIPNGGAYGGYPAVPIKDWHRGVIALKKLIMNKK